MILTYKYRVKGRRAERVLAAHAIAVNQVWNYCVAYQRDLDARYKLGAPKRRWASGFGLCKLTAGTSSDLGIMSGTINAVCLRFAQARENLKKIRALIRRIQNRGYATLGRIVAHLDRLAVGDEANAVIDALDAVSLMTVHAAKGLEFPVVFIVNMARGIGNRRDPIRVAADPSADSASVSVGNGLS